MRFPRLMEWEGTTESYEEAKQAGFPDDMVRGNWKRFREKGARCGTRQAIKPFTKVSRDQLKLTLRNAVCHWLSFATLTYPEEYPADGRECKRHLNLLLTHMRKHYPGIKYVWFLEFQESAFTHLHHVCCACTDVPKPALVPYRE